MAWRLRHRYGFRTLLCRYDMGDRQSHQQLVSAKVSIGLAAERNIAASKLITRNAFLLLYDDILDDVLVHDLILFLIILCKNTNIFQSIVRNNIEYIII